MPIKKQAPDSIIHAPLTDLVNEEEIVINRLHWFRQDWDFREKVTDLELCTELYENTSSDGDTDGIPRRNLIRRVVDDHHAVAIQNVAKARLIAERVFDEMDSPIERELRHKIVEISEKAINSYVRTILSQNEYDDERNAALKHAAIYGAGYIGVFLDTSGDIRFSDGLKKLMRKPLSEWTERDADLYDFYKKRIGVRHIDSRDVYWQEGVRKVGPEMLRVSYVERLELKAAQRAYDDNEITRGIFPNEVDEDPGDTDSQTAIIHTWELVPSTFSKSIEGEDGEVMAEVEIMDWTMVYTKIVGGKLKEHKMYSNFADDIDDEEVLDSSIMLPVIPAYLKESENHPYGYAIPLMFEVSEEFINRMYTIMYKAARKAVATQGILVHVSALGKGDLEAINQVLDEGGVAPIRGNDFQAQNPDIRQVVQPLNYTQSSLPQAMIQAVQSEEAAFNLQSDAVNQQALASARSGQAKVAQIQAQDRPKTISADNIATFQERVYDTVFDLVRHHHKGKVQVTVDVPGAGRQVISLNQEVYRVIPDFDASGLPKFDVAFISDDNPDGLMLKSFQFVLNDVTMNMKAQADGRGELPRDPVQKLQLFTAWQNNQYVDPMTAREFVLPEHIKAFDDRIRKESLIAQQQMLEQQAKAQQQLAAQQAIQANNGPNLSAFAESGPQAPPPAIEGPLQIGAIDSGIGGPQQ